MLIIENYMYEQELLNFIEKSVSSFHAISEVEKKLQEYGFKFVNKNMKLEKGEKYYFKRNNSSLIAVEIGSLVDDDYGFNIVASHSDSPTFKIKPNNDLVSASFYHMVNVEGYGGMIDSTWLDRPLSVAGRIMIKNENGFTERLVNIDKNLLTIPNVAIHQNREVNTGMKFNQQVDMIPLVSIDKPFMDILSNYVDIDKENILSFDLFLYNRQRGNLLGYNNEFIQAPQLDDLSSAYASLEAFVNSKKNNKNIKVYACFDNEEVGSRTMQGAASDFLDRTLEYVNESLGYERSTLLKAFNNSFLVSADNAQAVNPNHPEKYDALNRVFLNKGLVIKFNADQSYTTDSVSCAIFKIICDTAGAKYQVYTNRSDLRGGGTLGNISATHVSVKSIDIGLPQLAMHSSYETMGAYDLFDMIKALIKFYESHIRENGLSYTVK